MIATEHRVAAAFGRAHAYDAHALVQRRAAEALARRICTLPLGPAPRILEIGCGTGFLAAAARLCLPGADWLMTDLAPEMVERSRRRFANQPGYRFAVLDGESPALPGGESGFDCICSSLTAQWFGDLEAALAAQIALLRPGGFLILSTLASGTFAEWRRAHQALGLAGGTRDYPAEAALAALRPGGVVPGVAIDRMVETHRDARGFLVSLRAIGAGTPRPGHRPLSPRALRAVMRRFEEAEGAAATYVVATCCFRRPEQAA